MRTEHRITIGLLLALLAQPALRCQTPDWQAGIVQIKNKNLSPGTGFIVTFRSGRALIVTAAHVVEGDDRPKIMFQGNRDAEFTATVLNQQVGETRGFALLEVRDPPPGLRIVEPQPGLQKPAPGTAVTVVGYPASIGVFSVVPSTVTATQAADLLISPATEEGFSGGPILIDGRVAGMTYGKQGAYGKAVPAAMIDTYLRLADPPISWSAAPATTVAPAPTAAVVIFRAAGNLDDNAAIGGTLTIDRIKGTVIASNLIVGPPDNVSFPIIQGQGPDPNTAWVVSLRNASSTTDFNFGFPSTLVNYNGGSVKGGNLFNLAAGKGGPLVRTLTFTPAAGTR